MIESASRNGGAGLDEPGHRGMAAVNSRDSGNKAFGPPPNPKRRLEELVERLDDLPEEARSLAQECIQSVLTLHGEGMARVLQLIANTGQPGQAVTDALLQDKLVRTLLLIHGLHPESMETRLRGALEKVRPYLQSHGGNLELVSLEQDIARLRFNGACQTCPSSAVTMELAIRRAVEEACPDLMGLELESPVPSGAPGVERSREDAPGQWIKVPLLGSLQEGEVRKLKLENIRLVICKWSENLYAYRDHCPACGMDLASLPVAAGELKCRLGHRYEVRNAGRSPTSAGMHLDPFPLLVESGAVRVAVK
jgi:Fe-S cluster biogenesis protein NfuA/nitrite reductase/ring-hydroxylating ferredoxin subunit